MIEGFAVWRTPSTARALGATHYAWMFGIIPGFYADDGFGGGVWIARSDIAAPLEYFLSHIWAFARQARGEEEDFGFLIGDEIPEDAA